MVPALSASPICSGVASSCSRIARLGIDPDTETGAYDGAGILLTPGRRTTQQAPAFGVFEALFLEQDSQPVTRWQAVIGTDDDHRIEPPVDDARGAVIHLRGVIQLTPFGGIPTSTQLPRAHAAQLSGDNSPASS